MEEKKPRAPVKTFTTGAIQATIWANSTQKDGEKIEYKTVSFARRYKDKQGNWKSSTSLRQSDLPKALVVLRRAYEHLVLKELHAS